MTRFVPQGCHDLRLGSTPTSQTGNGSPSPTGSDRPADATTLRDRRPVRRVATGSALDEADQATPSTVPALARGDHPASPVGARSRCQQLEQPPGLPRSSLGDHLDPAVVTVRRRPDQPQLEGTGADPPPHAHSLDVTGQPHGEPHEIPVRTCGIMEAVAVVAPVLHGGHGSPDVLLPSGGPVVPPLPRPRARRAQPHAAHGDRLRPLRGERTVARSRQHRPTPQRHRPARLPA
jgi:hypothetical protein